MDRACLIYAIPLLPAPEGYWGGGKQPISDPINRWDGSARSAELDLFTESVASKFEEYFNKGWRGHVSDSLLPASKNRSVY